MKRNLITIQNFIVVLVVIILLFIGFGYFQQNNVKRSMQDAKLNDLMNFIDAKYVHLLDFLDSEKSFISLIAKDNFVEDAIADPSSENISTLNNFLNKIQDGSMLQKHAMKQEKEKGTDLSEAFGREVKWDIYRLDNIITKFDEVFLMNKSGKVIASSRKSSIGKSLAGDEIFTKGSKELFTKDVYKDYTGNIVFGFAAPVKASGSNGVLGIKVDVKYLNDLITGDLGNQVGGKLFFAGLGEFMDLYIVNKDGLMITQSKRLKGKEDTVFKKNVNTLPVQRCLDDNAKVREAMETYPNFLGEDVAGVSMCEFGLKWTMIAEQTTDDAFKTIYSGVNNLIISSLVGIIIIFILAILFSYFMWKAVRKSSNQVISSASQLFGSSKKTSEASDQSASIAYELASGATEQSKQVEFISKTTGEMARAVQKMSASAKEASDTADRTSKSAQDAQSLGAKSQNSLEQMKNIIIQTSAEIKTMAEKSRKIEEVVETINNIASKTHILSLNAAIEASRAGDAGGGFAIIAEQVRDLAASSSDSAKLVKEQIGKIVQQINETVIAFDEGVNTANKSSSVIKDTLDSLEKITSDIQKVTEMISIVSTGIEEQASSVQEIASNMDSIATVADQNATGSMQLSSSIEQLSTANKQVADAASQLHGLASDLQNIAGGMKTLNEKIEKEEEKPGT